MAERLGEIGRPILATGITKLEAGQRRVDADDLVALAIALDVTPNTLLLPSEPADVDLTPVTSADFGEVWAWARGQRPLGTDWNPMSSKAAAFIERSHPDLTSDRGYESRMPAGEHLKLLAAYRTFRKIIAELEFDHGER